MKWDHVCNWKTNQKKKNNNNLIFNIYEKYKFIGPRNTETHKKNEHKITSGIHIISKFIKTNEENKNLKASEK